MNYRNYTNSNKSESLMDQHPDPPPTPGAEEAERLLSLTEEEIAKGPIEPTGSRILNVRFIYGCMQCLTPFGVPDPLPSTICIVSGSVKIH